jgi:hypothetical protein
MMNIGDWITVLSSAIMAGATVTLVAITVKYVKYTYGILKQNEKLIQLTKEENEEAKRPYINVRTYDRYQDLIFLLIKNEGKSSAKNVQFSIDKDIFQDRDENKNIRDFQLFKYGAEEIPPGLEYHYFLGYYPRFYDKEGEKSLLPFTFKITCNYSYFDKTVAEPHSIDIRSLESTWPTPNELEEISGKLKKIEEYLNEIKGK